MKPYTLGLYEKAMPNRLSIEDKLACTRNAGYDFMEISIDETEEKLGRLTWSKEERARLNDAMRETGIPIRTMCLSGHRKYPLGSADPSAAARSLDIMEKALDLADDLGIRIIMLAGYDVYYEESNDETRNRYIKNMKRVMEMAASKSILLGFETMETEFMNTVAKAMDYVRLMDSGYLGVYPDVGNITNASKRYHTRVTDDLQSGKGHLLAMHLKETLPGIFREVPYGMGHVDFEEAIRAAWELGIRKFVTEFWYTGNEDWEEQLVRANRLMTEILNRQSKRSQDYVC